MEACQAVTDTSRAPDSAAQGARKVPRGRLGTVSLVRMLHVTVIKA